MNRKYLLYVATPVLAVSLLGMLAASGASAASDPSKPFGDLISAIATKFNVSVDSVKQLFVDHMAKRQENREAKFQENLSQSVADGELTQDQANAITAKKADVGTQIEALQGSSESDRKTEMKEIRTSLKQWSDDNNISLRYMMPIKGFKGHPAR